MIAKLESQIFKDFVVEIVFEIGFALGLIILFAFLIYGFRKWFIRTPDQMQSFLNRRFDMIRRKGFWGEEKDYIDEDMILTSGRSGWGFVPLATINISHHFENLWSFGGIPSLLLLFFAGKLFADARAGVFFLRTLGVQQYRKQTEHQAEINRC